MRRSAGARRSVTMKTAASGTATPSRSRRGRNGRRASLRTWAITVSGLITARDNEKLKLVRKLHSRRERDRSGLFVCEGEDLVEAARAAGFAPVGVLGAGGGVDERVVARGAAPGPPPRAIGGSRGPG